MAERTEDICEVGYPIPGGVGGLFGAWFQSSELERECRKRTPEEARCKGTCVVLAECRPGGIAREADAGMRCAFVWDGMLAVVYVFPDWWLEVPAWVAKDKEERWV